MKLKFDKIKQLTDKDIIEGIKHCFENSDNLYTAAELLQQNKTYNIGVSLLTLSVEELMKALGLFNLLIIENEEIKDSFKDLFESNNLHVSRLDFALYMTHFFEAANVDKLISLEITSPEEMASYFEKEIDLDKLNEKIDSEKEIINEWFKQANQQKNAGLYVSQNNKRWYTPKDITEINFIEALEQTNFIRKYTNELFSLFYQNDEATINMFIEFWRQTNKSYESKIINKY